MPYHLCNRLVPFDKDYIFAARIVCYEVVGRFKIDFRQQFEEYIWFQLLRSQSQNCPLRAVREEGQQRVSQFRFQSPSFAYARRRTYPIIQTNGGNFVGSGNCCDPFSSAVRKQRSKPGNYCRNYR